MKLSKLSIYFSLLVLFSLCVNFYALDRVKKAYDSLAKTSQLSKTSTDLTNNLYNETSKLAQLVRLYTTTGDTRYLFYYYDILAIRDGQKSPPQNYNQDDYWDRVIAKEIPHPKLSDEGGISLSQKMQGLGFTDEEFDLLNQVSLAVKNLHDVEQIAFASTQGLYDPKIEDYVSEGEPNLEFANKLVFSDQYNQKRAALVSALSNLSKHVEIRTNHEVEAANSLLVMLIRQATILTVCTSILILFLYILFKRYVLTPIKLLDRSAHQLAQAKYSTRIGKIYGPQELSTLGATFDLMSNSIEEDIKHREEVQKELEQANLVALEATHAKSLFLANMSHEIRTPMNAIIGMAYLTLQTELTSQQKSHIDTIHTAGQSLLNVINDILDFSKIEAGKVQLEQTLFRLEDVITQSLSMIRQNYLEKDIEVLVNIKDPQTLNDSAALIGDPIRLGQIFNNLLSNAVKFTHKGFITLKVEILEKSADQITLNFCLQDTGIGMTQEQIGRLFQEFEQADSSTTRKYGGTGLGLAISKNLINLMDGDISITSTPDVGTTFCFSLKFGLPVDVEVVPNSPNTDNLRILIVDDKPEPKLVLSSMLKALGFGATHRSCIDMAYSGKQGLDMMENAQTIGKPYDLVFLDWVMPNMDATDFLASFNQREGLGKPEIVIVSANNYESMQDSAQKLGVKHFLSKPVMPEALRNVFRSMFNIETTSDNTHKSEPQKDLQGMQILLVEDNKTNQLLIQELLKLHGIEADIADNGREGLEIILNNEPDHYDLVLMDLQMPIMDGHQTTIEIRKYTKFDNLPIIAITAHAMADEIVKCREIGMNGHIPKPITPSLLYSTLGKYNKNRKKASHSNSLRSTKKENNTEMLTAIPGIDLTAGLKNAAGEISIYHSVLANFINEFKDYPTQFPQLLEKGDWESAERTTHSLAGLTGTIGATQLVSPIKKLEKACNSKDLDLATHLFSEISIELTPLLDALQKVNIDMPSQPSHLSAEDMDNIFQSLKHLLNEGDLDVIGLWNDNCEQISSILANDLVPRLDQAINEFNFEKALEILNEHSKRME